MRRLLLVAVAATLLPACTNFFRDRSQDYVKAESTPPLSIPESVSTRPIKPLYPIPQSNFVVKPELKAAVVPYPPAMEEVKVAELPPLPNLPGRSPVKLGTDGNGVPELRVIGPRERIWDELGRALKNADVTVTDRNQSLGLVEVSIAQQNYQVRMVRATEAFVVSVQRDDETLAPVNLARNLLGTLQARWP